MTLFWSGLILAWFMQDYDLVQQRKLFARRFEYYEHSLRYIGVYEQSTGSQLPRRHIPWKRLIMGDGPVQNLIYVPSKDPDGSQLRRTQELFPEARIWVWPLETWTREDPQLPPGVEPLEFGVHGIII